MNCHTHPVTQDHSLQHTRQGWGRMALAAPRELLTLPGWGRGQRSQSRLPDARTAPPKPQCSIGEFLQLSAEPAPPRGWGAGQLSSHQPVARPSPRAVTFHSLPPDAFPPITGSQENLSSAQPVPVQRASIFPAAGKAGKNNHVHKTRRLSRSSGPAEILWPAATLTTVRRTAPGAGLAWGTAAPRASAPTTTCHSADVPGLALAPPRQLKGTYPRGQRRGMVMKRCCCETAGPWARHSGGLRHSSAEATRESQRWARGDAEPDTTLSKRSQSREGQSQKQLVKRAQKHLMLVARQSRAV